MRRFLVILLMLVLPLRAWAGDAMAVTMAGSDHSAMVLVAAAADKQGAAGQLASKTSPAHADCHGQSAQAVQPGAAQTAAPTALQCDACSACQMCHFLALGTAQVDIALTVRPSAPSAHSALRFLSAERASSLKPPIS